MVTSYTILPFSQGSDSTHFTSRVTNKIQATSPFFQNILMQLFSARGSGWSLHLRGNPDSLYGKQVGEGQVMHCNNPWMHKSSRQEYEYMDVQALLRRPNSICTIHTSCQWSNRTGLCCLPVMSLENSACPLLWPHIQQEHQTELDRKAADPVKHRRLFGHITSYIWSTEDYAEAL